MAVLRCGAPHSYTYADYRDFSRTYGDELIDGVAYVREPPSPSLIHQEIVRRLCGQLSEALEGKPCRVFVAPLDVLLPKAKERKHQIDTVVQPDVFIVCDRQKMGKSGIVGAPDWIAEVLSPSTVRYDQRHKVPRYERAGVRELWLVEPLDRKMTRYRLKDGRYGEPTTLKMKGRTQLSAVSGVRVNWDKMFKDIGAV